MEILILSFATFFNIVILIWKFKKQRFQDMAMDISVLFILSWLFKGTITGLAVATTTSCMFSLYLLIKPPGKKEQHGNI